MSAIVLPKELASSKRESFKVVTAEGVKRDEKALAYANRVDYYIDGRLFNSYSSLYTLFYRNESFNGVVQLQEDVQLNATLYVGNDATIDLNSHRLTHPFVAAYVVQNGASLKVENGELSCAAQGFQIYDGSVELEDVKMNATMRPFNVVTRPNGINGLSAKSSLTIGPRTSVYFRDESKDCASFISGIGLKHYTYDETTGKYDDSCRHRPRIDVYGELIADASDCSGFTYCFSDNGAEGLAGGGDVVVHPGAVISAVNGFGIHVAAGTSLSLLGGYVYGDKCAIDMRTGYLTVPADSSVSVVCNGVSAQYDPGHFGGLGATDFDTGDALILESCSYGRYDLAGISSTPPQVSIKGGTFRSAHGNAVASYQHTKAANAARYLQSDYDAGIKLDNGSLGEVGAIYAVDNVTGGGRRLLRNQWTWKSSAIEDDETKFWPRVEDFMEGGDVEPVPATEPYQKLTGQNASWNIVADGYAVAE